MGLRVPEILLRNGVEGIVAQAVCQMFLLCDPRRELQDIEDQLSTEASTLPEPTVALLRKGGIAGKELKEHNSRAQKRLSDFRSRPDEVVRSGYLRVMAPVLVFVGRTPGGTPGG